MLRYTSHDDACSNASVAKAKPARLSNTSLRRCRSTSSPTRPIPASADRPNTISTGPMSAAMPAAASNGTI
ncbi:hypothetical protein D3C78_1653460 [compost metagenome]